MQLLGEYRHTIDAKNRIFIPVKIRELLGESFIVTRKVVDNCIGLYSEYAWERMAEKLNNQPDSVVNALKKFIFSKSSRVTPDSQGRIVIPAELCSYAKLEKNAVVIGAGDHAQIWSEVLWDEQEASIDFEEMTAILKDIGF